MSDTLNQAKPQDRRYAAMRALHAYLMSEYSAPWPTQGILDDSRREEIADAIESLAILGRTQQWRGQVRQWGRMVRDTDNKLTWAYAQGSVYVGYAA